LAAALCVLAPTWGAATPTADEVVPAGVLLLRLRTGQESVTQAFDHANKPMRLAAYLLPVDAAAGQITGDVTRTVSSTELQLGFGLTDRWNIALTVPYLEVRQDSTLASASGDSAVQRRVSALQSRESSGVGNLRIVSLHRPVFTDSNGFTWGFGFIVPSGAMTAPYLGPDTLDVRGPNRSGVVLLHYTRYPGARHSRFDLRVEAQAPQAANVNTLDKINANLQIGNSAAVLVGWQQELGPALYGVWSSYRANTPAFLDGINQDDLKKDWRGGVRLGLGNLIALEQGPVALPYQVSLDYEQTLDGANIPQTNRVSLDFHTYF
jgi:hypothetical protein